MATVAVGDRVEQVTRVVWRLARADAARRVQLAELNAGYQRQEPVIGRLAKACGATAGEVQSWLQGQVTPPCGAALALLSAIDEGL